MGRDNLGDVNIEGRTTKTQISEKKLTDCTTDSNGPRSGHMVGFHWHNTEPLGYVRKRPTTNML
jgi:hypothetical protein